jgi:uncharacterized membrane protein
MASSKQTRTKAKPRPARPKSQANGQPKTQASTTQASTEGNGQRPPAQNKQAQAKQAQVKQAQVKQTQTRRARDRARARELAEERAAAAEAPDRSTPPFWLQLTTLALSIAGLGVSIYMTIEHFTGNTTLACSANGAVNCLAVTTSPESKVFGVIPVAVLGLAFYVFMAAATSPWAWRSRRPELALVRLASVVVGIGFVLYLIYVELFQVGYICLWCTGVHVITFALFALVVVAAAIWGLPEGARRRPAARR